MKNAPSLARLTKVEREAYNAEFARTAALCLPREKIADYIWRQCQAGLREAREEGYSHWDLHVPVTSRDEYKKEYRSAYLHQHRDGVDQVLACDVPIRCTRKRAFEIADSVIQKFCASRARRVLGPVD